jgi:outer membrane protein assembly factor BamD
MRIGFPGIFASIVSLSIFAACSTAPVAKSPMENFKLAEENFAKGKFEEAITEWKKVKETYSSPQLVAEAELKIADAQFANKSWIEAAAAYEDFRKLHPAHEKASYALYRAGLSYFGQVEGIDTDQAPVKNAAAAFEKFLTLYPQSEYAGDARAKLIECRTKMARYENYVGRFYLRTGKYPAAIRRLEGALEKYPHLASEDETLLYLGTAYLKAGERAKARETFSRLIADYPKSPLVEDAKKTLGKD